MSKNEGIVTTALGYCIETLKYVDHVYFKLIIMVTKKLTISKILFHLWSMSYYFSWSKSNMSLRLRNAYL